MQSHLMYVTVTINQFGIVSYTYAAYPTGKQDPGDVHKVQPGDQVAWYVRVLPFGANTYTYPAYELTFADQTFFATASLPVPAGSHSPYVTVHALFYQTTKYTLKVAGMGVASDPAMQTDPGGGGVIIEGERAIPTWTIQWNANNSVTINGAPMPNQQAVNPGDTVVFASTPAGNFGVLFTLDPGHQSLVTPFTNVPGASNVVPGTVPAGAPTSTAVCTVQQDADSDTTFPFYFFEAGEDPSATYALKISQPPAGRAGSHSPRS